MFYIIVICYFVIRVRVEEPERIVEFPGCVDGMGAGRDVRFLVVARPGPGLYACGACVVRSGIHNHSG